MVKAHNPVDPPYNTYLIHGWGLGGGIFKNMKHIGAIGKIDFHHSK